MSVFRRLFSREDPHSLAAPYALDALEPAERVRFERHLTSCDRCAAEVRDLTEDAVRLAWSTAAPAPPALPPPGPRPPHRHRGGRAAHHPRYAPRRLADRRGQHHR
ncbi:RskA family anti-sigma factor, partial [Streptomyces pseudogriseolus]|uniref:RskA family anti-sigma factor n=1 Tax=Streptomyces pseudogriseolus TaxID=36817 RepID=UPI003FA26B5E